MQNDRNQQGQSMAPAIDYLNQVQRIYFDSWRRCGDAGVRWTRDAMDEFTRIGQDLVHLVSETQGALVRTLGESTRATADTARTMAAQAQQQLQAQHGGARHEGAHDKREGGQEKREAGPDKREGAARGKGGQDNPSTVHQRAGG